mgnify:CR=1 FL=1
MKFKSSKRFGPITTGHRQWRDDGHCSFVHGYGRYVRITFESSELDERGWVMDFGDLKDVKKCYYPGIEESCRYLYDMINPMIKEKTDSRVEITRIEIWEHENNHAEYVR